MKIIKLYIILYLINLTTYIAYGQGLDPGCPPCNCECGVNLNSNDNHQQNERGSNKLKFELPTDLLSVKEGLNFVRARITKDPIKYIARETLKEVDRIIDNTADSVPKLSVFMEAVAGHILDAVLPGSSKLIDGIKFILAMTRSSKAKIAIYKTQLDPNVQADLLTSIEVMLSNYEKEHPNCLRSFRTQENFMSLHNFQYHEGACPTTYDRDIVVDEKLELSTILIQAPVDFSRLSTNEILFRGLISVTFDHKYTIRLHPSFISNFDDKGIQKLLLLYGHSITANISQYTLTHYFSEDDVGTLAGDQFSLCLQEQLFKQMNLKSVKSYSSSLIPYTPKTFSKDQINVKRLVCKKTLQPDSCASRFCNSTKEFIDLVSRINGINIPTDFDTGYPRSKRSLLAGLN